jgi:hypothetical protein
VKPLKTKAPIAAVGLFWSPIWFRSCRPADRFDQYAARSVPKRGRRDRARRDVAVCLPEVGEVRYATNYLGAGSCPDGSEPVVKVVAAVGGDNVEGGERRPGQPRPAP